MEMGVVVEVLRTAKLSNVVLVVLGRTESFIMGVLWGGNPRLGRYHILGLGLFGWV